MTGFLKELHSILTATEALIFKIKIVPCPFLIRVLTNRFKNTKNKVMYKPTTPCLEKPRRFKQVDLHFVSPMFFVCYSVTHYYCTKQSNNLCLFLFVYGEPFSLLLQQYNSTCTIWGSSRSHVREAISCYFRVPRWLILCCQWKRAIDFWQFRTLTQFTKQLTVGSWCKVTPDSTVPWRNSICWSVVGSLSGRVGRWFPGTEETCSCRSKASEDCNQHMHK